MKRIPALAAALLTLCACSAREPAPPAPTPCAVYVDDGVCQGCMADYSAAQLRRSPFEDCYGTAGIALEAPAEVPAGCVFVKYTMKNSSDRYVDMGCGAFLEYLLDGDWYGVPRARSGFDMVAQHLSPGQRYSELLGFDCYDTALSPGRYRLAKPYRLTGDGTDYVAAAEFDVVEGGAREIPIREGLLSLESREDGLRLLNVSGETLTLYSVECVVQQRYEGGDYVGTLPTPEHIHLQEELPPGGSVGFSTATPPPGRYRCLAICETAEGFALAAFYREQPETPKL